MKLNSVGLVVSEKTIFQYIDWTPIKHNCNLLIAIVSIRLTYQVKLTLASKVFQQKKKRFIMFPHLIAGNKERVTVLYYKWPTFTVKNRL